MTPRPTNSKHSAIHQLEEEFGKRYGEYLALNKWMDNRLAIFNQLQAELNSSKEQERIIFKVVVEEQRLKHDREYQGNMEKLEECCAALMMIKARLGVAVASQQV